MFLSRRQCCRCPTGPTAGRSSWCGRHDPRNLNLLLLLLSLPMWTHCLMLMLPSYRLLQPLRLRLLLLQQALPPLPLQSLMQISLLLQSLLFLQPMLLLCPFLSLPLLLQSPLFLLQQSLLFLGDPLLSLPLLTKCSKALMFLSTFLLQQSLLFLDVTLFFLPFPFLSQSCDAPLFTFRLLAKGLQTEPFLLPLLRSSELLLLRLQHGRLPIRLFPQYPEALSFAVPLLGRAALFDLQP
mmetsp:Transcript_15241/g.27581  ORF Transcript_15241/g.27581 Transcript_15241/m.27581 type:complete len:239 (+) Transcript_15241:2259-2975(+)